MSQGSSTALSGITTQMEDEMFVFHSADPQSEDPARPEEKQGVHY